MCEGFTLITFRIHKLFWILIVSLYPIFLKTFSLNIHLLIFRCLNTTEWFAINPVSSVNNTIISLYVV